MILTADKGRLLLCHFVLASSRTAMYAPVRAFAPTRTHRLLDGEIT